jgi:glycine betaine/proline transport system permease protein
MDFRLHIGDWIEIFVEFLLENFQGVFDVISAIILWLTSTLEGGLLGMPNWLLLILVVALSFWRLGWKFAVFSFIALGLVMVMGLWETTVSTLALVVAATLASLVVALPAGIIMAKSDTVESVIKPVLDFMQTMPPFVYLIPAAMFFGLGKVPGTIATIIFAMPPAVRLTNLGIRQVPKELVEAGQAFGCTGMQLLRKVQIPSAMPSIMAGINQNVMMALSMVVIASMIGAGGLGNVVLRGIQRMDIGLGFEGGIGVVILAILLDRISQTFGQTAGPSFFARIKALFSSQEAAE